MNQPILLYRSGSVYANETAAWAALDAVTHKKGQPIVAFYTLSSPVSGHHGSSTIGAIFAIGIGDGVGQYKACTSHDDMLIVAQSLNAHITQFNQMFEYDANHNAIKAKLDFYTTDGKSISAGGIGSGSSASLGALYQLVDVMANSSNTGVEGAVEGSVLAYDATAGKWKAIAQSEILPDMSGYYTKDETDSAINTAKSNLQGQVDTLKALIPATASADNQLADKDFVNSSIATATAEFRGSFTSLDELKATSGNLNDYAFYLHTDSVGNKVVDRYKWTTAGWLYEYTLNNSSFTAEQWAALNSAITATLVQSYNNHLNNSTIHITAAERTAWNAKWDYNEEIIKAVKVNAAVLSDSATKLQTPCTLWGQSFDGSGDISGIAYFPNGDLIHAKDEGGTYRYVMGLTSALSLGYGTSGAGIDTYISGKNLYFHYSTSNTKGLILNSSGNVTIGASDLAGDTVKLYVNGGATVNGNMYIGVRLSGMTYITTTDTSYGLYQGNFFSGSLSASDIVVYSQKICMYGNVLINTTTDNGYKLDVNGRGHYSGDLICGGEVIAVAGEGTPAGVTDYSALTGKPLINGVTLVSGNNTLAALGIQAAGDYATNSGVTTLLADYATKTFISNNYAGKAAFNSHIADTDIHITSAERVAWNAKWDYNEDTIKAVKVTSASSADSVAWVNITNKPSTFTPSAHTHTASEISGLPTKLSAFTNDVGYITGITKSMVEGVLTGNITSHTHTFASLTEKPTTISGYGITDALTTSNYNSYAPTLTGTGASGTWGINISGNAATATNANTLDGYDSSNFVRDLPIQVGTDLNSYDVANKFIHDYVWTNAPASEGIGSVLDISYSPDWRNQLFFSSNYNIIYSRIRYGGTTWTNWIELASIYSNVASATKLQTPRTLWGQSFDGTGNVSGHLTGVSGITFTSNGTTYGSYGNPQLGANALDWTIFSKDAAVLLQVLHNGNILIGATTDNGYKLQVNGSERVYGDLIVDGEVSALVA